MITWRGKKSDTREMKILLSFQTSSLIRNEYFSVWIDAIFWKSDPSEVTRLRVENTIISKGPSIPFYISSNTALLSIHCETGISYLPAQKIYYYEYNYIQYFSSRKNTQKSAMPAFSLWYQHKPKTCDASGWDSFQIPPQLIIVIVHIHWTGISKQIDSEAPINLFRRACLTGKRWTWIFKQVKN